MPSSAPSPRQTATPPVPPPWQGLSWTTLRITYAIQGGQRPSPQAARAWRGAWGHALKEDAPSLYHDLFECPTSPDHPLHRRFRLAPVPYVVYCPPALQAPGQLVVDFTLIGQAQTRLPDLFPLLLTLQNRPVASQRIQMDRYGLHQPPVPEATAPHLRLQLDFASPLRLPDGQIQADGISPQVLGKRLAERLALLAHFHAGAPLVTDYSPWLADLSETHLETAQLRFRQQQRYSARQQQRFAHGGWTGPLVWQDVPATWLPWLHMGSCLHLGKGSPWGMGKYQLSILPAAPPA